MPEIKLNEGQAQAKADILEAVRNRHALMVSDSPDDSAWLLTGAAGCGKTFVVCDIIKDLMAMPRYADTVPGKDAPKIRVAVTAPTHKAVQVLSRKLAEFGINAECMTIHSLIGLKPAIADSEKQVLKRASKGCAGDFDFVVIDESSMNGTDLQAFIDEDLFYHFVLYVADAAQLPPVGEDLAPILKRMPESRTSRLTQIVRQAEGNPILQVATILRKQQNNDKPIDYSWMKPIENGRQGIYIPGGYVKEWMRDAFTSDDFKKNNDAFRYIAYTNQRVHEVNEMCRQWIYGKTETPFVSGERILCRNPVLSENGSVAFATNQEAVVADIEEGTKEYVFPSLGADQFSLEGGKLKGAATIKEWSVELPVWKIRLVPSEDMINETDDEGNSYGVICNMPKNRNQVASLDRKLVTEAKANRGRWYHRFSFLESLADLRPVYALTCHTSQGSTFGMGFVDIPDISKRERSNPEETKKLLYVAITRFSDAVVLVG